MMAASRATALARSCEPPLELARRRTERAAASGWGRATTGVVRVPQGLHGLRRWRRCQATAVRRSSSGRAPRRPTGPPLPRGIRRRRQRRSLGREKLGGGLPPVANQTGDGDHLPPWCFFFFLWPNPTDKPRPPLSNPTTTKSSATTSYASSSSAVRSCCHRHRKQLLQHSPPQQHAQHSSTQQPIPTTRTALVGAGGLSLGAPAVVAQTSPGWASCSSTATSAPDGAAAQPRARDGGSARVAGTGEAGPPARPRAGRWG